MEQTKLISITEAQKELGLSHTVIALLCLNGRIEGAFKVGKTWAIPSPIVRIPAKFGPPGKTAADTKEKAQT